MTRPLLPYDYPQSSWEGQLPMARKKDRERNQLKALKSIYPGFPCGTIVDHEAPDFLIRTDSETVGIELVDYVRGQGDPGGSVARRDEVVRLRIAEMAKAEFEATHGVTLEVHFFWYPHRHPSKSIAKLLASEIAGLVSRFIPQETHVRATVKRDQLGGTPLEEYLHSVFIVRLKNSGSGVWSEVASAWVEVAIDELQQLIGSKDIKIDQYSKVCDSVWLVIVTDELHLSSFAELVAHVKRHRFQTDFGRVIWFDGRESSFSILLTSA